MDRRGGTLPPVSALTGPPALTADATATANEPAVSATSAAPITLVERAQAGDESAFEVLVERRLDRVFRVACAILGNEADAHDATQETFLAAWRNLTRLRDPRRFDAWLGRIAINACRQSLRGRNRHRIREIRTGDGLAPVERLVAHDTPLDERAASGDALGRAFETLSSDQRAILVLHHLEHQPLSEIAAILDIPTGTAKSRLHAARQALQRALEVEQR